MSISMHTNKHSNIIRMFSLKICPLKKKSKVYWFTIFINKDWAFMSTPIRTIKQSNIIMFYFKPSLLLYDLSN